MKVPEPPLAGEERIQADLALLTRILARDASAVGELYDRHNRLLFGLILRIIRDRSEAEEILQEVFLVVWDRAGTYNPTLGSPAAWLVGITRNRAIDRLRANASRLRAVESARLEPVESPGQDDDVLRGEQRRTIMRALDAIPQDQRQLIEDAYFLGFTQTELADRYKLPLGTVKTRIRSGLLALREQLTVLGNEP